MVIVRMTIRRTREPRRSVPWKEMGALARGHAVYFRCPDTRLYAGLARMARFALFLSFLALVVAERRSVEGRQQAGAVLVGATQTITRCTRFPTAPLVCL